MSIQCDISEYSTKPDELLVLKAHMSALSTHGVSKRIDENGAHAFMTIWAVDLLYSLPPRVFLTPFFLSLV